MPTKIWIDIDVLAQLVSEIGKQEDVTKYFVDRVDASQERADELTQEVLGKDAVIGVQKRQIQEFEEKFNKMAEENADLDSGVGVMSDAIEEKNKQIDMARERISSLEATVDQQKKVMDRYAYDIAYLNNMLETERKNVSALRQLRKEDGERFNKEMAHAQSVQYTFEEAGLVMLMRLHDVYPDQIGDHSLLSKTVRDELMAAGLVYSSNGMNTITPFGNAVVRALHLSYPNRGNSQPVKEDLGRKRLEG